MNLRAAAFFLLSAALFAQFPAPVRIVGVIEAISGPEIRLKTGAGTAAILIDAKTQVLKSKSVLKPGAEISAECAVSPSGKLLATNVWAGTLSFTGIVVRASAAEALV